ncbi:MAG: 6-phosphogluconolactonase [Bifidobacterium psychraerophilum]|uniref:6-phosphogluconolactonase n=1 Tax=Bifidobacterium psychraerophilum TaxID=218140 RepID=UPI0039EB16A7
MPQRLAIAYPNPELLHTAIASRLLIEIGDRIATQHRADIALTGGTDGNAVLRHIASNPLNEAVDWSCVHLWWGDERFVPADSDDRNAKQAREAWFGDLVSQGLLPESHIHEMPADQRKPQEIAVANPEENDHLLDQAANTYQQELIRELGDNPAFDVAMFGVGPDGHFASLFPDFPQVVINDPDVFVTGVSDSPKMPPLRLSLTVPFIRRSRKLWILASSPRKAPAVHSALSSVNNPHVPSSFASGTQETLWLLDEEAAASTL